VNWWVFFTDY